MSKEYDQIANVSIDIASAVTNGTSFDNILIIGALPTIAPSKAPEKFGVYTSLDEVIDAGWVATGSSADPVGIAARVAFSQSHAPARIYIAPIQTSGTGDDVVAESAVTTLNRALESLEWWALCPVDVAASELKALADVIEINERAMIYNDTTFFDINRPAVNGGTYYRSIGIFAKETSDQEDSDIPTMNKIAANVAWAVEWLYYRSGSETAAFKELTLIEPATLSPTEINALKTANMNHVSHIGGKNVVMNGKTLGGEWCDIIRFRDWIKNDVQYNVVRLFTTTPKIPYLDNGIALIQNVMEQSLKNGQDIGGIADDEYTDDGDVTYGYTVFVPRAAEISDVDKAARVINGLRFVARLSGAIHFAEIRGTLAYSL